MTKDDIIKLAQEAGFVEYELDDGTTNAFDVRYERFANLVAAAERERIIAKNVPEIEKINTHIKALEEAVLAEREACAKVCLETEPFYGVMFANAIRARGTT